MHIWNSLITKSFAMVDKKSDNGPFGSNREKLIVAAAGLLGLVTGVAMYYNHKYQEIGMNDFTT